MGGRGGGGVREGNEIEQSQLGGSDLEGQNTP